VLDVIFSVRGCKYEYGVPPVVEKIITRMDKFTDLDSNPCI
jgi:hypothetical protein